MMITNMQLAAMSRIDILEEKRLDFYLYVDEFQNFATESFANILSEARKYKLNLIMAHQYIEQMNEVVKPAVFGNVGTIIVFRVGAADAEELVKEFTPKFTEENLVNIPKWECYMKLMVDGIATDPFSAAGLPPLKKEEKTFNMDKVIRLSRERYSEKKEIIEEKISRWAASDKPGNNNMKEGGKNDFKNNNAGENGSYGKNNGNSYNDDNDDNKFSANCYICGKETKVSFKPDNIRPVFCRDCFKKVKQGEISIDNNVKNNNRNDEKNEKKEIFAKEVSLQDALKSGAVDFKGKKVGPPLNDNPVKKNNSENNINDVEKEKSGEKMKEIDKGSADNLDNLEKKTLEKGKAIKF